MKCKNRHERFALAIERKFYSGNLPNNEIVIRHIFLAYATSHYAGNNHTRWIALADQLYDAFEKFQVERFNRISLDEVRYA